MSSTVQNRAQILSAAEPLFRRFGYRKTTVADIARSAGMAKGSIYLHFSSKEDIFLAILSVKLDAFAAEIHKILSQNGSVQDRLLKALSYFIYEATGSWLQFFPDLQYSLNEDEMIVRALFSQDSYRLSLMETLEGWLVANGGEQRSAIPAEEAAWIVVQALWSTLLRLRTDQKFDYRRYFQGLISTIIPNRRPWPDHESNAEFENQAS
jgi:AcrR family transcriptional regulator